MRAHDRAARAGLFVSILGFLALVTPAVHAEEALPPRHSVVFDSLTVGRVNPLGGEERLNVAYRHRLWNNPGLLFRDAYASLAFTPTLSPAVSRVGGTLELKPLAVVLVSAGYYLVNWFGTFEYLQSYTSPLAGHSDTDLDLGDEAGRNYATSGTQLELRVQVLGKVGPIVLRNDAHFFRTNLELQGADDLYYDIRIDAMVANGGWAMTNDTDLIWLSDFGLVAGLRASVVHAWYPEGVFEAGEATDNPNGPTVRLGPLLAYVLDDEPGGLFARPTLLLVVNWWLKHRYRTGADTSAALPYLVLGFRFEGELFSDG